jgi:hypothetical protein
MRIHVVGATARDWGVEQIDNFRNSCRSIGREIAKRGHEVAIGSLREVAADRYIVEGMKEISERHKVIIYRAKGDLSIPETENQILSPDQFDTEVRITAGTNYSRHLEALNGSNVTLAIGGNRGTATAGFIALALRRPVLALPGFGGASTQIWDAVSMYYGRSTVSDSDLKQLSGEWGPHSPGIVVNVLEAFAKVNFLSDRIQVPQIVISLLLAISIAGWITLFVTPTRGFELCFFILVGLSSIIGTAIRTNLKLYFDIAERFSVQTTLSDFITGVVLAFIFFLIYQLGGIIFKGDSNSIISTIQDYRRGAIFMSITALSSAFLLERSVKNIRDRLVDYVVLRDK